MSSDSDRHNGQTPASLFRHRVVLFAVAIGIVGAFIIGMSTDAPHLAFVGGSIVSVIAWLAGLWLLAPVDRYVEYIERLATGDFDEEAPPAGAAQYEPLSAALESMRLHLRTWMSEIARNAIEFEGSLQVLDVISVMHFLRRGKRTGTLLLQRGGETAMLFWQDGEVCGALLDGLSGSKALEMPFQWERGSFKFSPRLSPVSNLDARWEILLLNGVRGVKEPRLWSRFVPKPATPVRKTRLADHTPLRQLLTPDEWTVWTAFTGHVSAEELSARLGQPVAKVWHKLYCFAALGVIESLDDTANAARQAASALQSAPGVGPGRGAIASDPEAIRPDPEAEGAARGTDSSRGLRPAVGDNVISLSDQRMMRRER